MFEIGGWVEGVDHVVEVVGHPLACLKIVCDVLQGGLAVRLIEAAAAVHWKRAAAVGSEVLVAGRKALPEVEEVVQKPSVEGRSHLPPLLQP